MIVKKSLSLGSIYRFTGQHLIWLVPWMAIVTAVYYYTEWRFMTIPWLPLSLIGTAVAFYVGFKNSQSYGRLWEARKIWGAIINSSRKLGTMIKHFRLEGYEGGQTISDSRKQFIYRHIAYVYQLRKQLLESMPWEHMKLRGVYGFYNRKRHDKIYAYYAAELNEIAEQTYLSKEETEKLETFNNNATHLLDIQTEKIQQLFGEGEINMLQQMKLQEVINDLYDEQGKAERIKRFPFPRQYGGYSFVFVCIFVFLLPFGIVGEFSKLGGDYVWLSVPVGVIVGWIYVVMEMIGDYSENPFEGLHNDIPMLSICRTIEIDLLQVVGEKNVPKAIKSKGDFLI